LPLPQLIVQLVQAAIRWVKGAGLIEQARDVPLVAGPAQV